MKLYNPDWTAIGSTVSVEFHYGVQLPRGSPLAITVVLYTLFDLGTT